LKKFAGELERALDAGDVASLQLRLKSAGDDEIRAAARTLQPPRQPRLVPLAVSAAAVA